MAPITTGKQNGSVKHDNIAFIRQMLGELRQVAASEGADMLCYLLEMAYVEAGDLQAENDRSSIRHGKRY
jgi:hypothetical protein